MKKKTDIIKEMVGSSISDEEALLAYERLLKLYTLLYSINEKANNEK